MVSNLPAPIVCGIGVDLVEYARMREAYLRRPERLPARICLEAERDWVSRGREPWRRLAAVFGVKEAVMKALGTGMKGVGWREIDTRAASEGPVTDLLRARALTVAHRLGVERYAFSWSGSGDIVIATALLSRAAAKGVGG